MKLRFILRVFLLAALFLLPTAIVLAQSGGYNISWWTVDGGGETFSTGGAYRLGGTIGQPDAGELSGGSYTLYGGFWNRDFPSVTPSTDPDDEPQSLPDTGFAPGQITRLFAQPAEKAYAAMNDLWLEIPALDLKMDIVGVPLTNGAWDVSWLGEKAGWLESTAFPTWSGNSVLTAHVWNADNTPGPFVKLNTLRWGDRVIIHGWEQEYIYEVRSVTQVQPDSITSALEHKDTSWLTLLTCQAWDAERGTYRYRVLVQAALIEVK